MNKHQLNLIVDEELWNSQLPEVATISQHTFNTLTTYMTNNNLSELFIDSAKPLSVNLSLSNNATVHQLNKEFRNMDKPTNVLSFANIDAEDFALNSDFSDNIELGDIIIALETLKSEAETKNISLHDHFCHLLIHGLLHLLGYDHQTDEQADIMEGLEIKILQQLNIKNPYEE